MSGGTQKINMASSTHADTSWHHVALIRNASSNIVGLYIDGNQEAYYTMTDSDEDTYSGLLYLGQRGDGNYYFDGNIDEVRISQGNIFNAIPNSSNTDTITMPTAEDTTEYTDSDLTTTSGALSGGDYNSTTYIKDHAFDGNSTSTRWASVQEYGYVNGAAWIGNDLGESKTITGLRIKQGNGSSYGCITSAILQYYDDNSTSWVNVQTLTLLANEEWQSFVINNGISAQKWRLLANSDTNNYCWQVYQIEMFDESSSSSASSSSGGQLTLDSSSTYASGITLAPSSNAIELLQRSSADFTLKCDFIKVTANGTFSTFDTADFESESTETTSYADPNSSSAITVDATAMIKRVTNPPSDFTDGAYSGSESVTYDDGTTVFYGMFEINFGLDTSTFSGNVTVGIYIRKPEDAKFKKIGKISASAGSSMTYYWNSRAVYAGDDAGSIADDEKWTSADIGPYRSNGPVQFMFRVE
jgi:hypothetical protein